VENGNNKVMSNNPQPQF